MNELNDDERFYVEILNAFMAYYGPHPAGEVRTRQLSRVAVGAARPAAFRGVELLPTTASNRYGADLLSKCMPELALSPRSSCLTFI